MESERRLAALLKQRYVITGLTVICILMALIVGLTIWSRRRMAEKNRGLYRQIKEQDHLSAELERMKLLYETDASIEKSLQQHSEDATTPLSVRSSLPATPPSNANWSLTSINTCYQTITF